MIAYFSDQFITFGVHIIWDVKPIVLFDYSRSYNIFNAIRLNNLINVTIGNYCCPLKVSEQRDIHPQCCCNGIADDFSEGKPLS